MDERLDIDNETRTIRIGDVAERLSKREMDLLQHLIANEGRTCTRDELIDSVWPHLPMPESNVVDVYVGYLRRKLERVGSPLIIRSVRGEGYALEMPTE